MSEAFVFCEGCGGRIPAAARFCPACGRAQAEVAQGGPGAPTLNMSRTQNTSYAQPPQQVYSPPPAGSLVPYGGEQSSPGGVPAYTQYTQNTINYQYQPQVGVAGTPPRDPMVAMLLELIGYLGFLGIGHIYAGRVGRGIALMIGWMAWWVASGILSIVLVGCCMMVVGLAFPILSGIWARSDVQRDNAMRGVRW